MKMNTHIYSAENRQNVSRKNGKSIYLLNIPQKDRHANVKKNGH